MRTANQVFLQLREADRYACTKNPLLRRLAVVLLDNVVELELSWKARSELILDRTTWYQGVRQHDHKVRSKILRYHDDLLEFAKSQKWIAEEDTYLLRYAHRVRNAFYHEGRYDALDAELSVRLLYRFVHRYFPIWRTSGHLIEISPHEPVLLEAADDDATGFCPLLLGCEGKAGDLFARSRRIQSESYWKKAMKKLLTYRPSESIRRLIKRKADEFLETIERQLEVIGDNKETDFNLVLEDRFGVLTPAFIQLLEKQKSIGATGALNIYLAVVKNEQKLLDISEPEERADRFHELLKAHAFDPDPIPLKKVKAWRKRMSRVLRAPVGEGIGEFLNMEEQLHHVLQALLELASDLDGHTQMKIDEALGK